MLPLTNITGSELTLKISNKTSKQSKIDKIKENINNSIISKGEVNYKVNILDPKEMQKESGSSTQMKVQLISENVLYVGRIKQIKTLNEAIIYHKMHASKDALTKFTPEYFGVFDAHGNSIDLEHELKLVAEGTKTMEDLNQEHPTAWMMMKDITHDLPGNASLDRLRDIQDFKFVKDGLVINKEEILKHGHTQRSKFYTKMRLSFLSLSDCSFSFQKSTKSKWYNWVIVNAKRILENKDTKQRLQSQFIAMDSQELKANMDRLEEFKTAVLNSEFTFNDSSLLFVPTIHKGKEGVSISLIDLGHGMHKDEGIKNFNTMKQAMANSIDELLAMMKETLDVKNAFIPKS